MTSRMRQQLTAVRVTTRCACGQLYKQPDELCMQGRAQACVFLAAAGFDALFRAACDYNGPQIRFTGVFFDLKNSL